MMAGLRLLSLTVYASCWLDYYRVSCCWCRLVLLGLAVNSWNTTRSQQEAQVSRFMTATHCVSRCNMAGRLGLRLYGG